MRTENGALSEYFYLEYAPAEQPPPPPLSAERPTDDVRNQLF